MFSVALSLHDTSELLMLTHYRDTVATVWAGGMDTAAVANASTVCVETSYTATNAKSTGNLVSTKDPLLMRRYGPRISSTRSRTKFPMPKQHL